eukprot:NODE_6_length_70510_cov_1.054395.p41 type:complete len:211 gc:universal NODE_6_length_70510_cov_1.054395:46977-46345(-)
MEKSSPLNIFLDKFSMSEIQSLFATYKSYLPSTLPVSQQNISQYPLEKVPFKTLLMSHFGFSDTLILDRIFKFFDSNNDGKVNFEEFVKGMCVVGTKDFQRQIEFCFFIFDLNGDKYITKEEMMQLLNRQEEEDEEMNRELVEIVLKKLDEDKDGKISETDWAIGVAKEPLLLQAFGKCLPSTEQLGKVLSHPTEPWLTKINQLVSSVEN